jgi:(R,R)-butanediol dehydrogenase / meso-butanediol dehydrogenase / diacetyl reductase
MPDTTGSMLAAVYQGQRTITVDDVPVPDVGPDQVLLEVSHCGICGTDLHMLYEDWGTPGSIAGHEYSGVVVQVGEAVEGWQVGDRAVGGPSRGCGDCRQCGAGRVNLCAERPLTGVLPFVGAFARFKMVRENCLYRIPDGLDLRTAALTEPVAVALRGVHKSKAGPGDRVLVTGAGPIGLLSVAILRTIGVTDITVSEPAPLRKALAAKVGATEVIEPDSLKQPVLPMEIVPHPFQAAIECSGHSDAMEAALCNLDLGATLVLSGTGMRRPKFDGNRIIINELTIAGTVEYSPDDYADSLNLLASGQLPTDVLIEPEDRRLGTLEETLAQLSRGEIAGKVLVVPNA